MDKMKLYESTLSYHAKGPSALHKPEKIEESKTVTSDEIVEALEALEAVYEEAIEIQTMLEENGIDIDELFSISEESEEVDEGFQNMSKTKALIARRRAGRRKKLTVGYQMKKSTKK